MWPNTAVDPTPRTPWGVAGRQVVVAFCEVWFRFCLLIKDVQRIFQSADDEGVLREYFSVLP